MLQDRLVPCGIVRSSHARVTRVVVFVLSIIGDATSPQLTPDFQAYLPHPGRARGERTGARLMPCQVAALGPGAPGRCPLVWASGLLRHAPADRDRPAHRPGPCAVGERATFLRNTPDTEVSGRKP